MVSDPSPGQGIDNNAVPSLATGDVRRSLSIPDPILIGQEHGSGAPEPLLVNVSMALSSVNGNRERVVSD